MVVKDLEITSFLTLGVIIFIGLLLIVSRFILKRELIINIIRIALKYIIFIGDYLIKITDLRLTIWWLGLVILVLILEINIHLIYFNFDFGDSFCIWSYICVKSYINSILKERFFSKFAISVFFIHVGFYIKGYDFYSMHFIFCVLLLLIGNGLNFLLYKKNKKKIKNNNNHKNNNS